MIFKVPSNPNHPVIQLWRVEDSRWAQGQGIIPVLDSGEAPQHEADVMERWPRWGSRRRHP